MFLQSVELFGFKSFADRSKIEFRDGISALLGPNGCGKSNVVDAVKWVLGEQSTRSLRADRMEDIIFNGTESRKALNVAEVTLTLSNDQGFLPIDMPEIAVKRRLHRSGESEYFINNTPVRLKEVRELFFDTGIGKSSYSIMEQGKIDQILSNKPEERRFIFEEAAGITKYKYRGAEAERKLQKTEENMQQVENILREVKRSYNTLKIQSEKTAQYRDYNEKIFDLELETQLLKLKELLQKQQEKEEHLEERSGERNKLRKNIDEVNDFLEKNLDQVNDMESRLIEGQKKLYGLDIEQNNLDNRRSLFKERSEEIDRQISISKQREEILNRKIVELEEQGEERRRQIDEYLQRLEQIDGNIGSFEQNIESARRRIHHNNENISGLEQENRGIDLKIQEHQKELHTITDDIVAQLDQKLRESSYSSSRRKEIETSILTLLQEITIQAGGRADLVRDMKSAADTKTEDLRKALEKAILSFESLGEKSAELSKLFNQYRDSIPAFIDDFLAPEGIITRKRTIEKAIDDGRNLRESNGERLEELRRENGELGEKIDEYRKTLEELRVNRVQVETRRKAVRETLQSLDLQIGEQQKQLEENRRSIAEGHEKLEQISRQQSELKEKQKELEQRRVKLRKELEQLEKGISRHNVDLSAKEASLKKMMEALGKTQDRLEKIQMEAATLKAEIKSIYSNFYERHGRELSEFETRMFEIAENPQEIRSRLQDMKQKLKDLGQVNLMAPEEFVEVKERHDFLTGQLDDLYHAREDLQKITKEIRTESTELFIETYEQIKKNFHSLFRRLFGGGRGELRLTDPDNILESGVEIFAQPPGKSLENIALLSGGERSLTAVGLLFATYMVKPSPFCILDEIDAALDEANVGRFINLLIEFGTNSQFVVITHNKKTVAGANTMLGVTMQESGVSRIIAVRLSENGEVVRREQDRENSKEANEKNGNEAVIGDTPGKKEVADGLPFGERS